MAQLLFCFLLTFAGLGQFPSEATASGASLFNWRFLSVNGFSWSNCDGESLPGKIKSLSVSPDPINIPGDLTVSTVLETKVPLTSPVKVIITAEKELLGEWMKVPCIDNVGSCTYDNVCELIDTIFPPGQQCPEPLRTYGLPCHCPFKEGVYSLPDTTLTLPDVDLPAWLANGNYRVTGVLIADNKEIGCGKFTFSLDSSSWWF
ncbi:hypothetical protein XENTR_v10007890 [Xenopus tropicalis]|uniref:GM2 ganglioside activator protein n=1 Tax=Xenopus tropicalis TaxID=8364 RepID=Q5FW01_XENTR|eukprot:NP_001017081.1 ganglioside GM2 activator precursor [Xenopus tropicalis]